MARVLGGDRLECQVESGDRSITLAGSVEDIEPAIEGTDPVLASNKSLVSNAWAFTKFTYDKVNLPTQAEQEHAADLAKKYHSQAVWIADAAGDLGDETTDPRWCSGCLERHAHRKANRPFGHLPTYVCENCGTPTITCAGPGCNNMAVRGHRAVGIPRFCAEHRHEIPGFEKASRPMGNLSDYEEFLRYEATNLARVAKTAGAALAGIPVLAGLAFAAAPAIGGAVGTLLGGYSGAAATSYGLATLGGGSLAAGGLGMAGGTMVITVAGGAVGSALGASVANAYLREDKSFHIELLRDGGGIPVVISSGFLNEGSQGWGNWRRIVTERYPDSPVYRVHWGSKELKDLAGLGARGATGTSIIGGIGKAALRATRLGARRLGPLGAAFSLADLSKNPWYLARNRAEKTGVIIADLLARTDAESYVLIGHSLGARMMVNAAQSLGTKSDGPRLQSVHLPGAAIGAKSNWSSLADAVEDKVYNYHSSNDSTLKRFYRLGQLGEQAAGIIGLITDNGRIVNIDVSNVVPDHSAYLDNVTLA